METKEKIETKRIQNWEYYADKYNLVLDNENYDDLERAFDEIREQSFSQQKQEIIEKMFKELEDNYDEVHIDTFLGKVLGFSERKLNRLKQKLTK